MTGNARGGGWLERALLAGGALLIAGAAAAWLLVDPVVQAMYDQRAPEVLNRLIPDRDGHDVGYYQQAVRDRVGWLLAAAGGVGVLTMLGAPGSWWLRRRLASHPQPQLLRQRVGLAATGAALLAVVFAIAAYAQRTTPSEVVVDEPGAAADDPDEAADEPAAAGALQLSAATGFYDEPFDLTIEGPGPISYTLDGSYPDPESNPDATQLYDGPIPITDRTGEEPALATIDTTVTDPAIEHFEGRAGPLDLDGEVIEQATVVRARSGDATATATYFVGEGRVRDQLPVISLALDPGYLFDHDTGIYVAGATFDEYRASDDFDPDSNWNIPTNYNNRGREWERPFADDLERAVVFEYCAPGGECAYQRDVGLRVHGRFSRSMPQKSLRLYARNDYGERRFLAPLFGDDGPVGHRRLLLRNSGNDNRRLMFADAYLQSLMGHFHADTQAYEPTVVFINGEYWGIHNLRERYDRHYLEVAHGADPDAVEILDNTVGSATGNVPGVVEAWHEQLAELGVLDPAGDLFGEQVERVLDVDSFYDFVIGHVFVANSDWPHNNVRWWREPAGPHRPGEGPRDGRWRWLISDFDHMGERAGRFTVDYDPLDHRLAPTDDPEHRDGFAFLFTRVMANEELRERFLVRFSDHLNTSFRPEHTLERLDGVRGRLAGEIDRHGARWETLSLDEWEDVSDRLAAFMRERPDVQRDHLRDRFDLGGDVSVEVGSTDGGEVRLNTVDLVASTPGIDAGGPFHGTSFAGLPLTVTATPDDGYRFAGWEGLDPGRAGQQELHLRPDADVTLTAIFEPR